MSPQSSVNTPGIFDIHFHGAYGIDLMSAIPSELDELSEKLFKDGVSGFLPTTLSAPKAELVDAVSRLGAWIESTKRALKSTNREVAIPVGIHLEGPFINPKASGAHTPSVLRKPTIAELELLWEASKENLALITLAPELLTPEDRKKILKWATSRGIGLAIGHSVLDQKHACDFLCEGFIGVTHGWNAMKFHHREPGIMGGAVGHRDRYIELIIDGIHVDPTVLRWTLEMHGHDQTIFVSDCAPAAGLRVGKKTCFGDLEVEFRDGASRLASGPEKGALAGGGNVLPAMFSHWVEREAQARGVNPLDLLGDTIGCVSQVPCGFLVRNKAIRTKLLRPRLRWKSVGARLKYENIGS